MRMAIAKISKHRKILSDWFYFREVPSFLKNSAGAGFNVDITLHQHPSGKEKMSCEDCEYWNGKCTYPDRTQAYRQCQEVSYRLELAKEEDEKEYWRRKWEEEYYRQ